MSTKTIKLSPMCCETITRRQFQLQQSLEMKQTIGEHTRAHSHTHVHTLLCKAQTNI